MRICNHTVSIVVISLLTAERKEIIASNKVYWGQNVHVHRAIDGFNHTRVAETLNQNKIKYHKLCKGHTNFGMLACWLSHYEAMKWQVEQGIQWVARFEDDIQMSKTWKRMLSFPLCSPAANGRMNAHIADMTLLGSYGEAYLTSLAGAKRMIAKLRHYGVIGCQDQQMNIPSFMNTTIFRVSHQFNLIKPHPWKFVFVPNRGDIRKTKKITSGWMTTR